MSNPKGEVSFEADGKRYTLVFSINALCELEDRLGDGVAALANRGTNGKRFKILRTMFSCALLTKHPDLTEADAGRIIDAIGISKADDLISEAFVLAFPETKAQPVPLEVKPATGRRARTG